MSKIDDLLRLHEAATPGPWERRVTIGGAGGMFVPCMAPSNSFKQAELDAALIAAMRNALPALLEVADALRGLVDRNFTYVGAYAEGISYDDIKNAREALRRLEE